MKSSLKLALLASSLAGLALTAAPDALARYQGNGDSGGSIPFALETGGYCDSSGCPDRFWKFPIHYGPVFANGRWFKGPVYFRDNRFGREYWVLGGWHRDEWRGHRPWWARQSHDGPALAFEYYASHGFRIGDHWRHEFDADNRDWNGGDRHDHGGDNGNRDWHRDNSGNGDGGNQDWHPDNRNDGGNGSGDWHRNSGGDNGQGDRNGTAGGANGAGGSNNDQGRPWDNRGRSDNGGPNDRHGGNGNNDQNAGGSGQPPAANTIHVTAASYGATCHQAPGNVTSFLAQACNGRAICEYVVQYQTIGDPSPGCAKDFSVQWTCSAGPGGSVSVPAEAGLGSKVTLQCSSGAH